MTLFRHLFFTLLLGGLLLPPAPSSAEILRVAVMGPLSGPEAVQGQRLVNGVKTAVDEALKTIPAFRIRDIEVIPQDTSCEGQAGVIKANHLANRKILAVIGPNCADVAIPASLIFDHEKIFYFSPLLGDPRLTDRGLSYVFRLGGREDEEVLSAAEFLRARIRNAGIFLIVDEDPGSIKAADLFQAIAPSMELTVARRLDLKPGTNAAAEAIAQLKSVNPAAIYILTSKIPATVGLIAQIRQAGQKGLIVGPSTWNRNDFLTEGRQAVEGVIVPYRRTTSEREAFERFRRSYEPLNGPADPAAAAAFDAAGALLKAVEQANSPDPQRIRQALLALDYEGASRRVRFTTKGDAVTDFILGAATGGKLKDVWDPVEKKPIR